VTTEYVPVPDEHVGLELDEFLCLLYPEWGKGYLRRLVREGLVLVDGQSAYPSQRLRHNQVLVLDLESADPPGKAPVAPSEEIPVLYEDEHVFVVDKPSGLAVEPERWARGNASLAGAVLRIARDRIVEEGEPVPFRPRLVHRIDKGTSGAVLLAKHLEAERILREAFEAHRMIKRYSVLVEGEFPASDDEVVTIDKPLSSEPRKAGRMRIEEGGKPSVTRVSVAARYRGYTLLDCEPLSGRTHQIRVHLASEGFPLAVDSSYGRRDLLLLSEIKAGYRSKRGRTERPLLDRLSMHAREIGWTEPLSLADSPGLELVPTRVEAPLPADLQKTLRQLEKVRPYRRS